jgi:carbon-monoxide dehydrogenase large subunit
VTNAVIDALRPLGVNYLNMPLSSMRIWETIKEANA